jgi:hypothetical protein
LRPEAFIGRSRFPCQYSHVGPVLVAMLVPSQPLIEITSLPNDNKRVRLVLKPNRLVISIDLKGDGSTLRYAKSDCSRSAL